MLNGQIARIALGSLGGLAFVALQGCSDSESPATGTGGSSGGRSGASGGTAGGAPGQAGGDASTAGTSAGGAPDTEPPGGAPGCAAAAPGAVDLRLTPLVTEGLTRPTFVTAAPGDASRLFILEQGGTIRLVRDGVLLDEPFLDLGDAIVQDEEQGLLGLAFHRDYAENGRLFVHYSSVPVPEAGVGNNAGVTSEFARAEGNADRADRASERRLLIADQPRSNHNGGMLAFGPRDGLLYIGRGNGGTADSQSLSTLLGKILRIDVDASADGKPYAIPPGNLQGAGTLPEIWSYGLRNPWRFSFDACTGDLYIGDVGEREIEEIDYEPANAGGRNYGWAVLEGTRCYGDDEGCDAAGMTAPVAEYEHAAADPGAPSNCSVTGGYVYRGSNIPGLRGTYLYADYCSGRFWSLRLSEGQSAGAEDITQDINPGEEDERLGGITSFGVDGAGEMYVVLRRGELYRIDPE